MNIADLEYRVPPECSYLLIQPAFALDDYFVYRRTTDLYSGTAPTFERSPAIVGDGWHEWALAPKGRAWERVNGQTPARFLPGNGGSE